MGMSQPVGVLLEQLEGQVEQSEFDCDLLIVGSGYGGAVAAARFSGATEHNGEPSKVWLLERGAEYRPGEFPSRFAELPGHVRLTMDDGQVRGRRKGLLDVRVGNDVSVLLGNGLGGGSLINANVMAVPGDDVFAQGWPSAITSDRPALVAGYQRAREMLRPEPLPRGESLRKLELLRSLTPDAPAKRAEVHVAWADGTSAAGVEMKACTACGDCLTGCNQGAKGSLDTNYLAWAYQRGVRMFTGVAASSVEPRKGGGWLLHWSPTDAGERAAYADEVTKPAGVNSHTIGGFRAPRAVRARRVILAAGTLGSTEILLRSRSLRLSDALGQGFSMNGDNIAAGLGHPKPTGTAADPEVDPAVRRDLAQGGKAETRRIGPTITGIKHVSARGFGTKPGFVIEEFGIPGALRRVFGEIVATLAAVRGKPMPGDDANACTEAHIERMSCYGLMGDDGAGGQLELPPIAANAREVEVEGQLRVRWEGLRDLPLFASMAEWLRLAFAGQATPTPTPARPLPLVGEVVDWLDAARQMGQALFDKLLTGAPAALKDLLIDHVAPMLPPDVVLSALGSGLGMAVTVHPLGGCRMGDNVAQGVVDADGRVWNLNTRQPYENLAVLDGSIVPRALGINPAFTITALAERAVPNLATTFGVKLAGNVALADLPKREPLPRQPLPPADAVWQLREVLQGRFLWGNVNCWARLRLTYEDIPGLARALQSPERQLNIRSGTLELYSLNPDPELARVPAEFLVPKWTEKPFVVAEVRGHLRLFMPLTNGDPQDPPDDKRVTMDYRLTLMGVNRPCEPGKQPLQPGLSLTARKRVGQPPDQTFDRAPSWLRQMTEADVWLGGEPVGRWALDYDDLATRREPLLSLLRHSNLPDAMLDAATGAMHVARLLRPVLVQAFVSANRRPWAPNLLATPHVRWPGLLAQCLPHICQHPGGARLSRYRWGTPQGLPVLLIHGMGAGGNSYTLPCVADDNNSLMSRLREARREVWVLDVRSSIGNEAGRHDASTQHWRAETIAVADIEWAMEKVLRQNTTKARQLDVFAHCMGAVMLWMAVLSNEALGPKIHAAVFSQVGPKLLPTPYNRLRGFLASYLMQYARIKEVDTCPDFECVNEKWQQKAKRSKAMSWLDAALATIPYPDDDGEADRAKAMGEQGWRSVRHRADAIFGQLFELGNLSDDTLLQLDALLGWVKMPMLAQAIHFARLRLMTDGDGRNVWLNEANLRDRLPFPLMIIHGRRNRVFDWRGSVDSLELLKKLAGEKFKRDVVSQDGIAHYGPNSSRQLLVFDNYGHFDCVLGQDAGVDIMGHVTGFLAAPLPLERKHGKPALGIATPLIGPKLGLLRVLSQAEKYRYGLKEAEPSHALRVLLQPKSRVANTLAWLLLPVRWRGSVAIPDFKRAEMFDWRGGFEPATLTLLFNRKALTARASTWAVLMLDDGIKTDGDDADLGRAGWRTGEQEKRARVWFLEGPEGTKIASRELPSRALKEVRGWWRANGTEGLYDDCQLHLPLHVLDAACRPELLANPSGSRRAGRVLGLALASCQYPPDLADRLPADASFRALLARASRDDGPQALLLVGDQVYLDRNAGLFDSANGGSAVHGATARQQEIRQAYELVERLPSRRRTLARLPSYAMLDDHEVADNWRGSQADRQVNENDALKAFEIYQRQLAPPSPPLCNSYGYYCQPAGLPLFVLDTRSERGLRGPQQWASAHILPEAELDALIDDLGRLQDRHGDLPKLIVSPVPLLPLRSQVSEQHGASMFEDDWAGYPASMRKLLGAVRDKGIRNLVLLSGDSHLSSVSRFSFGNNQIVSVTSSGLYAPWPFANQRPDDLLSGHTTVERHGVQGIVTVEAVQPANGFALVDVLWASKRPEMRGPGWTLKVTLCGSANEFIRRRIPLG